jgi:DNA-binding response OmpR family regulator
MVALVAETDVELRQQLARVLARAGYDVIQAGCAVELEAALRLRPLLSGSSPLAVLDVGLASACASVIAAAVRQRAAATSRDVRLILTYEAGTLASVAKPNLGPCRPLAIFEKPFDLGELADVAVFAE